MAQNISEMTVYCVQPEWWIKDVSTHTVDMEFLGNWVKDYHLQIFLVGKAPETPS